MVHEITKDPYSRCFIADGISYWYKLEALQAAGFKPDPTDSSGWEFATPTKLDQTPELCILCGCKLGKRSTPSLACNSCRIDAIEKFLSDRYIL